MLEMAEKGSFVSRASGLGLVKCDLIYLWWLPTGFGANLIILLYDGGGGGCPRILSNISCKNMEIVNITPLWVAEG